ncbi:MAG: hypothetical protein H6604_03930 [Flavobacteriales bacterium]|nr:hypothetical protein [Flavobacteriales bacterium]
MVNKEQIHFRSKEQRHDSVLKKSGNRYYDYKTDNYRLYLQVKKYSPHLLIINQEVEEIIKQEEYI